jgi:hydrogenase expression/formation protein HypC
VCLGIPGEVVALDADQPGMATVDVGGARRRINVMLVEEERVGPGDWVLIHVGFALAKIDEEEARLTLSHLEEMGQAYRDELQAISASRID